MGRRLLPQSWILYSVAASLLLALSAFMLSLTGYSLHDQPNSFPLASDNRQILRTMQIDFLSVRSPLQDQFWQTNRPLPQATLEDLYRNIATMEQARENIAARLNKNPENHHLLALLISVHQQELALLTQNYTGLTTAM